MATQVIGVARTVAAVVLRYVPLDPGVARAVIEWTRGVMLSGTAVTLPFVVTLVVMGFVLDFLAKVLNPFAQVLALAGITAGHGGTVAHLLTVGVILGVVFLAGVLTEFGSNTGIERRAGRLVESIPAVGTVYSSFDRMSEVLLESDSESFRDVKLIEFPHADVHSLAFLTSETADASGEDDERMLVLFVPMAPNPVMGGFMVCVPESRVHDTDMTVQEAFQAIVTSGVAMTETPAAGGIAGDDGPTAREVASASPPTPGEVRGTESD